MMYNQKLAMAVKVGGKVLREFGDQVYIPFGSEYSLYFKNLDAVRAVVKVEIDGEDIGNGQGFVVPANGTIDIERFVRNNYEGNRFKFIERTAAVEDHRGVGAEDGLIRVEYQFEKPRVYEQWTSGGLNYPPGVRGGLRSKGFQNYSGEVTYSATATSASASNEVHDGFAVSDAGITVEGSISDQQFQTVSSFPMQAEKHVMVLKLLGETEENKRVREAVTVKAKPKCKTCGTVNKANAKFCSECGTSLQIVA